MTAITPEGLRKWAAQQGLINARFAEQLLAHADALEELAQCQERIKYLERAVLDAAMKGKS